VLAACVLAGAAAAAAPSVDATLEPAQIALGESARLTILTTGKGTLSVNLPVVSGLEFRVVGRMSQVQITNGVSLESTSTIIRVTPEVAGVFTIPGVAPNSPPLVLRVTPGGGGLSSSPNNPAAPDSLPFLPGGSNANGLRMTADGSAFVHLEIPRHEIYVGESVPVEIQVGTRNGFAVINGLPKLNSSDFTLDNLSMRPEHTEKAIEGKTFTVFTWRSLLGAVKPGTFSVAFDTPLTVRMRTGSRQDSMLDDLLGDPFLQNIFGATVKKEITAASPAAALTVLPLPTEGRPADFSGAVGSFKITTDVSSAKATAGDPLTLRLHVGGTGNFDRVETSMLKAGGDWKTYEPKSSFNSADPAKFKGEKIFEQPLIATQPGVHTIPPLQFSYFDPDTRRYETVHSSPLTVMVSPAAQSAGNEAPPPPTTAGAPAAGASAAGAPAAGTAAAATAAAASAAAANGGDAFHGALRPDHPATGARVDTLVPLYFQSRFLGFASFLALSFAGAWVALGRLERKARGARERARLQMIRNLLERMAAAAAAGDAAAFFNAARSALQQALGARWGITPRQITLDDIDARLADDEREEVRRIFVLSDEANYSGGDLESAGFERWTQAVRRQVAEEFTA
jgi:hypothetical protein